MKTKTSIQQLSKLDTKLNDLQYMFIESNHDPLHIERKQQQRAITDTAISICLCYGNKKRAIKAWNYTLTDRSLKDTPYKKHKDSLRGLTIIGNWEDNVFYIITAYWDFNIKKKNRY